MCVFLSDQNCWWWACYAIMFLGSDSHPNLIKQKAIFNLYTCISSFSFSFWFLTIWKKNRVNVCIFMRSKMMMMMCMLCNFVSGLRFSLKSDNEKALFKLYTCISSFSFSSWFLTIWKKNCVNVCIFIRSKLMICACYAILFLGFDPHPKRIKKKLYFIFIHAYLHFGFWLFERKIGWTLKIEMLGGFWALKKIGFLWECGFRGYTGCYCRGCGACSGCCKESPCKEQRQRLGQCFRGSSC